MLIIKGAVKEYSPKKDGKQTNFGGIKVESMVIKMNEIHSAVSLAGQEWRNGVHLQYQETKESVVFRQRESGHVPPHLHDALEIVYVTKGTLEAGVGEELYHMEAGDIAFIFPDVIHHYQVFTVGDNHAAYIQIPPALCGTFMEMMQKYCPRIPVISGKDVSEDVYGALRKLSVAGKESFVLAQAYAQIILAKCFPEMELIIKDGGENDDLVYKTAAYIAANFREGLSLTSVAAELGVSKYVLSRVFSGTFRCNFNRYLNEARLNFACFCLENTNRSITEICMDSGFESQRTFNRVFKERCRMTPREYRKTQCTSFVQEGSGFAG